MKLGLPGGCTGEGGGGVGGWEGVEEGGGGGGRMGDGEWDRKGGWGEGGGGGGRFLKSHFMIITCVIQRASRGWMRD